MTAAIASRPPRSRRRRALLVTAALLAAVVACLGWKAAARFDRHRQLRALIAELDRDDPHWRIDALEARRATVPDAENSAMLIPAARALVPRPEPRELQRRNELLAELTPYVRLSAAQYRAALDTLEEAEPALAVALKVAQRPRGRHPIVHAADGMTILRHADDMNVLHDLVYWPAVLVHAHEGDTASALRACVCLVHCARSLADEPTFGSQLYWRSGFWAAALRGLERVLGQGEPADAELALVQGKLAEEARHDAWPYALRALRACDHQVMAGLERGLISPVQLRHTSRAGPRLLGDELSDWLDSVFPGDLTDLHVRVLRTRTQLLHATSGVPWHERPAAADAAIAADAGEWEFMASPKNLKGVLQKFQAAQAVVRTALAGVAAERFRLKHGHWPALAQLVPDFLPAVPADPFDGRPLRLARFPDGILIYAVGADGADDGGLLTPKLSGPPNHDIGFRLWDPNHRRARAVEP